MLIRNINPKEGLCNGTRLTVTYISNNLVKGLIQNGTHIGREAWIPRITLSTNELSPCQFTRRQFPIVLAFAITINKSQGQSLDKIGIYLPKPVFSHGALYVALSRCTNQRNIRLFILPIKGVQCGNIELEEAYTENVVYEEIIRSGF